MSSRFSIIDFFEALNNPRLTFNRLKSISFNNTNNDSYYSDRFSYNFKVNNLYDNLVIKYYIRNSSKEEYIKNSLIFMNSFSSPVFMKCGWLENEVTIYDNVKGFKSCNIAYFDVTNILPFSEFIDKVLYSSHVEGVSQIINSFYDLLLILADTPIVIDNISVDSLVVNKDDEVKISLLGGEIVHKGSAINYASNLARILITLLSSILKTNSDKETIVYVKSHLGVDISGLLCTSDFTLLKRAVKSLKSIDYSLYAGNIDRVGSSSVRSVINCFGNPSYAIHGCRDENRIVVIDLSTSLKGYASYTGELVIDCIYDELTDFAEGYAVAVLNGLAGVIDRNNNVIIDFEWDWIEWDCIYSVFIVTLNGVYSLYSRSKERLTTENYTFINSFSNGYAVVTGVDGKVGAINTMGVNIMPLKYDKIIRFGHGCALVDDNGEEYVIPF